jgi:hypothetical protein
MRAARPPLGGVAVVVGERLARWLCESHPSCQFPYRTDLAGNVENHYLDNDSIRWLPGTVTYFHKRDVICRPFAPSSIWTHADGRCAASAEQPSDSSLIQRIKALPRMER